MKIANRIAVLLVLLVATMRATAGPAAAKDDTGAGAQEAIHKALQERIQVKTKVVKADSFKGVLAQPVYDVEITIVMSDGYQKMQEKAVMEGKAVKFLPSLSTDMKVDALTRIIDGKFKLTQATTKDFQAMLDALYPTQNDQGPKEVLVKGTQFTFIRGKFFDKKMGFIVTTDAGGAVKDINYSLQIK